VLLNLHLLRALAALAVVYFHTTSEAGLSLPVNIGSHGVDVFFVISGFVMAYIGVRSPERFLLRRLIRIVPFYWTATLSLFAAAALMPHILRSTRADVVQLLCSLFFIPRETAVAGTVPTLILGWSLNYEMYFYVMFAGALAVAPRQAPLVCCVGIVAIAWLIDASGVYHPSVRFYARPLVFEFVYGVCVFYLFAAAERRIGWFVQRPMIRWGLWLLALGAALLIGLEEFHGGFGLPRFLVAGVPASVLVLSALLLERAYNATVRSTTVFLVGESSYVLYLTHPYVIYGLLRTMLARGGKLPPLAASGLVITLLFVATVAAVAIHVWFEKPVMTALRRRLLRAARDDVADDNGAARGIPPSSTRQFVRVFCLLFLATFACASRAGEGSVVLSEQSLTASTHGTIIRERRGAEGVSVEAAQMALFGAGLRYLGLRLQKHRG
jgi:peptidoglycan/LPS O-acetylase OafA/YrhL